MVKWVLLLFAMAGLIGLGFMVKSKTPVKVKEVSPVMGSYAPVAVLELFTSEGCSSCPPADDLLPQLAKLDSNIIPLSFHVDYWNRLGWEDPFSSSDYSDLQRQYSEQFHLESVYTPQLIVNGEYELVGSNRNEAESAIKKALQEKAEVQISIEDIKANGEKLYFIVHANGNIKKTDIVAALVQEHAVMKVKAGENRGSTLSHINVVRSFSKQAAGQKTAFELNIPKNIAQENSSGKQEWKLIIYTQQQNSLKITGAAQYNPR